MSKEQLFVKLNRFSAWVLLVLIVIFIISGYGMTKGIINPVFSKYLHEVLLPIPLFVFFVFHVGMGIRYAFLRWNLFNDKKVLDIYIFIITLSFLVLFLWLYFF